MLKKTNKSTVDKSTQEEWHATFKDRKKDPLFLGSYDATESQLQDCDSDFDFLNIDFNSDQDQDQEWLEDML